MDTTDPNTESRPDASTQAATSPPAPARQEPKEYERTPGLKLLDFFIYPVLTNLSVMAISVGATYLTSRGGMRDASGKLVYGKIGEWFQQRGDYMRTKFKALGMNDNQADMWKMVIFSFLDGSAMAPVVKMIEDRRETIGRWLDEKMGTLPSDPRVYEAEPKQSWLSLLGGRALTFSIVFPTALMLDRAGLNERFLNAPGLKLGTMLEKKPFMKRIFPRADIKELGRTSLFEAFYTSVCTLGLYFTSRRIAHFHHQSQQSARDAQTEPPQHTEPVAPTTHNEEQENQARKQRRHDAAAHMRESRKRPHTIDIPQTMSYADRYQAETASAPLLQSM